MCRVLLNLSLLHLCTDPQMDTDKFEGLLGSERAVHVRETARRLNPPEDKAKLAAEAAARTDAMLRTREQQVRERAHGQARVSAHGHFDTLDVSLAHAHVGT